MPAKRLKPKTAKIKLSEAPKISRSRAIMPSVHAVISSKSVKFVGPESASHAKRTRAGAPPSADLSRTTPLISRPHTSTPAAQGSTIQHRSSRWLWLLSWPIRWPFIFVWREKWRLISLTLLAAMILFVPMESAWQSTKDVRYGSTAAEIQAVPTRDVALVFGAGVLPDHTPSPYLKHRIETAVDLYKAGRVKSLLMSGNNSAAHHNETTVMKAYAISLGVDPALIAVDPSGLNTHDTCYRAHSVYSLNSVTVVTQGYHLPRAVMTCLQGGIDTVGVAAKATGRDWTVIYVVRESLATGKAYGQALLHSQPTLISTVKSTTTH